MKNISWTVIIWVYVALLLVVATIWAISYGSSHLIMTSDIIEIQLCQCVISYTFLILLRLYKLKFSIFLLLLIPITVAYICFITVSTLVEFAFSHDLPIGSTAWLIYLYTGIYLLLMLQIIKAFRKRNIPQNNHR